MSEAKRDWSGPPRAPLEIQRRQIHGIDREDPYAWLRNREDPRVEAYLEAENAYAEATMAHTSGLQELLYREMLGRIEETDMSVPYRKGEYLYFQRTEEGKQYPIYCRRRLEGDAPAGVREGAGQEDPVSEKDGEQEARHTEEVLLDPNQLARRDYFHLGVLEVSPDHRLLAYSVDEVGDEVYRLFILELASRRILDQIEGTSYSVEWANDNRTLFYTTVDSTNRPYRLFRHRLGSSAQDELVYQETDEAFFLDCGRTRSGQYLLLSLQSRVTSEVYYLPADHPEGEFRLIARRRQGIEYSVDHRGDSFYIATNEDAENFKLMRAPLEDPAHGWEEVLPHREEVLLEGVEPFQEYLAIFEREAGTTRLRILDFASNQIRRIEFPENLYTISVGTNEEFESVRLRLHYSSFVTPETVYDVDMGSGELELLKQKRIKGDFRPADYESIRLWADGHDGEAIPISLAQRREEGVQTHPGPLLLYAYGAYGTSMDPVFSPLRLSLLDRGIRFAIAHVRGGGERGRRWYRAGKLGQKWNTFKDFIHCAEHLIESGWTTSQQLAIRGGSAGGLLIGAVLNSRPDLCRVAIADVPFVDVVNTMLDRSIPLTVIEYEEWGNPEVAEDFEYILSYSPYDNVHPVEYPHLLVRAGLNDRRVAYWEPCKWVARLRARKAGDNTLLLKTLMGAGHGGASGRYDRLRDAAFDYAFLLDRLGWAGQP